MAVEVIISALAHQMGQAFVNSGVSGVIISNPYYDGTAPDQVHEAAGDAGINTFDDGTSIFIWPRGGTRNGAIPLIGPETGLVGYPKYTANGLDIVTLHNPNVQFGGQVQIESSLPQARGVWMVYGLTHHLESETTGGSWFSLIRVAKPGVPVLV